MIGEGWPWTAPPHHPRPPDAGAGGPASLPPTTTRR